MRMMNTLKENKRVITASGIALLLLLFALIADSTVISHETAEAGAGADAGNSEGNNPTEVVENSWESEVLPFFEENQQDAAEVLSGIEESDLQTMGEGVGIDNKNGSWSFIVSGVGVISAINDESRQGTAEVDLQPYDGEADFTMQIGPVINGYAIRDVLDFMKFDDFDNQIEWSKVGAELNAKSFESLEAAQLEEEKEIEFTGVLVVSESNKILTPVTVQE